MLSTASYSEHFEYLIWKEAKTNVKTLYSYMNNSLKWEMQRRIQKEITNAHWHSLKWPPIYCNILRVFILEIFQMDVCSTLRCRIQKRYSNTPLRPFVRFVLKQLFSYIITFKSHHNPPMHRHTTCDFETTCLLVIVQPRITAAPKTNKWNERKCIHK